MAKKKPELVETDMKKLEPEKPLAKSDEAKKKDYENYKSLHKQDLDEAVSKSAIAFHSMSKDSLRAIADNYKEKPFNTIPATADVLLFELTKRKMKKEVASFSELLQTIDWYVNPWMAF